MFCSIVELFFLLPAAKNIGETKKEKLPAAQDDSQTERTGGKKKKEEAFA